MKTAAFFMTFCLVIIMVGFSYFTRKADSDNLKITVSESEEWYKITADYPEKKTRKVQHCLDEYLEPSGMSFVNARIDGDIALENKVNFYIIRQFVLGTTELSKDMEQDDDPHKAQGCDQDCRGTYLQPRRIIRVELQNVISRPCGTTSPSSTASGRSSRCTSLSSLGMNE